MFAGLVCSLALWLAVQGTAGRSHLTAPSMSVCRIDPPAINKSCIPLSVKRRRMRLDERPTIDFCARKTGASERERKKPESLQTSGELLHKRGH